jgi:hypothetical protein
LQNGAPKNEQEDDGYSDDEFIKSPSARVLSETQSYSSIQAAQFVLPVEAILLWQNGNDAEIKTDAKEAAVT